MSRPADQLRILATSILFSTGGAAIKACSLGAWQVACLRSGIAALTILLLLPGSRRGWTRSTLLIAATYAVTMLLFVTATKLTTSASAIFLQATSPVYLLGLSPWLLREPIRRRDLLFMAAVALGLTLFMLQPEPTTLTAPDPVRGNILALMSGVTFALTVAGFRWAARDHENARAGPPGAVVLAGNVMLAAALIPVAWPFTDATSSDWLVLGYLGVFQIGAAYTLLVRGMQGVTALEASLLLLLEPVLNPIWSWLAHGESPGAFSLAGGVVIVTAAGLHVLSDRRVSEADRDAPGRTSP